MNTVIRLGKMLVVTSLLASSLAYGAPMSQGVSAKTYCAHKGYCARTSNSRIMFVDPAAGDVDSMLRFNMVDGQPIR